MMQLFRSIFSSLIVVSFINVSVDDHGLHLVIAYSYMCSHGID